MRLSSTVRDLLFALLAAAVITLVFIAKPPLQGAHWDAPIYLQRGKIAADTALLDSYRQHAGKIAAALPLYKPGVVDTPYWGFMRLGHTLLLGLVTTAAGASLTGLQVVTGLYTLMFALAVATAALLSVRLLGLFAPHIPAIAVRRAAGLSAGLYVASDIARYLAGNLVAEIPAMLLLTLAALLLVEATRSHTPALAVLSGVAAFALFATKMELVWGYVVFFLLYAVMFVRHARPRAAWRPFAVAAIVALALYSTYAWWFHPLADPRTFLMYARADQARPPNPVAPIKLWLVAGGMLWVGLLLGLWRGRGQPIWWFTLGWLGLVTVPYYDQLLHGGPAQARFFASTMVPLMVGSTLGWAGLLQGRTPTHAGKAARLALLVFIAALIGISHQESYRWLSALPGGWRLQYVKAFLSPPPYERLDYPVDELEATSRFLYGKKSPLVVVLDKDVPEEYSNIIAYFGPRLAPIDTLAPGGDSWGSCGRKVLLPALETVMFCTVPPTDESLKRLQGEAQVLRLQRIGAGASDVPSERSVAVFATKSLVLAPW